MLKIYNAYANVDEKEEYKVLQSNNLGKRLILSKMDRNR